MSWDPPGGGEVKALESETWFEYSSPWGSDLESRHHHKICLISFMKIN